MGLGLRSEAEGLTALASRDLAALWRLVDEGASASVALHDLLPAIVRDYGQMGAAAAADWYDDARDKAGVGRTFFAEPLESNDRGAHTMIAWALGQAQDDAALNTLILGGTQRRIADHMRLTVARSSVADSQARGWVRVGLGECDWCKGHLDGEVRTVAGYDFDAHDHCRCSVEPAFF